MKRFNTKACALGLLTLPVGGTLAATCDDFIVTHTLAAQFTFQCVSNGAKFDLLIAFEPNTVPAEVRVLVPEGVAAGGRASARQTQPEALGAPACLSRRVLTALPITHRAASRTTIGMYASLHPVQ